MGRPDYGKVKVLKQALILAHKTEQEKNEKFKVTFVKKGEKNKIAKDDEGQQNAETRRDTESGNDEEQTKKGDDEPPKRGRGRPKKLRIVSGMNQSSKNYKPN